MSDEPMYWWYEYMFFYLAVIDRFSTNQTDAQVLQARIFLRHWYLLGTGYELYHSTGKITVVDCPTLAAYTPSYFCLLRVYSNY